MTCVENYGTNRFKIAGLREGDEIVRINNRLPKDITWLEHRKLEVESDSIVYDIIRGKDSKRIVVLIDKNEKQGD